jgi:predicted SnoaL-like aldol condensation-catalyzing enzyme
MRSLNVRILTGVLALITSTISIAESIPPATTSEAAFPSKPTLFPLSVRSAFKASDATTPETLTLQVFNQWLTAFNTGDAATLNLFWQRYGSDAPTPHVSRDQRLRDMSGGLKLLKVTQDNGTRLVAMMEEKNGGYSEITIELASANPPVIKIISGHPAPSPFAKAINPATNPQTAPMTANEEKNLNMVLNWWREVIQGRHTELAERYQAEDYIQHNPNVPTGRAAFVKLVSSMGSPVDPMPEKLSPEPVVKGAKGDFVWLIFEHEAGDPQDRSKNYYFNSIDVLRIQNGKVQEHWDSAGKMAGSPTFVAYSGTAPSQWNVGKSSEDEQHSLSLATEELKDMLQYGHLELADKIMDPGYIQHNPNVPQGRDGFKQFMSNLPGRTPQEIKPAWKDAPVLTLVNGPFVVMMWDRKDKDPADPSKEYTWNHFDVVRVENGLIKEHWDEAQIAPPVGAGKQ